MGFGILSGHEINSEVEREVISIDPYVKENLNTASYDVTLGSHIIRYNAYGDYIHKIELSLSKGNKLLIQPGYGYLMHTEGRISTLEYVPILSGKSSIGRLFVQVHCTAGFIDPGFSGQITLEVVASVFPVELIVGMRIAQIYFMTLCGLRSSYQDCGHYVGDKAIGAVKSILWNK